MIDYVTFREGGVVSQKGIWREGSLLWIIGNIDIAHRSNGMRWKGENANLRLQQEWVDQDPHEPLPDICGPSPQCLFKAGY